MSYYMYGYGREPMRNFFDDHDDLSDDVGYDICDECGNEADPDELEDNGGLCESCANGDFGAGRLVQCCGTTRAGARCQITSDSVHSYQRRFAEAAEPLARGERYCTFHQDQEGYDDEDDDDERECERCDEIFFSHELEDGLCEECRGFMSQQAAQAEMEDRARRAQEQAQAERQAQQQRWQQQQRRQPVQSGGDDDEVQVTGTRTREERDAQGRQAAIDLTGGDEENRLPVAASGRGKGSGGKAPAIDLTEAAPSSRSKKTAAKSAPPPLPPPRQTNKRSVPLSQALPDKKRSTRSKVHDERGGSSSSRQAGRASSSATRLARELGKLA